MKQLFSPKLTISEGKNYYHSVNVILTHYHIICYPYIGIGRFPIRIIPCDCIEFSNKMDLLWYPTIVPNNQLRYSSVKK